MYGAGGSSEGGPTATELVRLLDHCDLATGSRCPTPTISRSPSYRAAANNLLPDESTLALIDNLGVLNNKLQHPCRESGDNAGSGQLTSPPLGLPRPDQPTLPHREDSANQTAATLPISRQSALPTERKEVDGSTAISRTQ